MAGPSQDWLSQGFPAIDPSWGAPPMPATPPSATAGPVTLESAISMANAGAPPPQAPSVPLDQPPPHPAPPAPPPQASLPPPPPEGPLPNDVQFAQVRAGGVMPAREVPVRGPTQNAHLMATYEAPMAAAETTSERAQGQAQNEAALHADYAQQFLDRQAMLEKAAAERAQEMRAMQQDFEGSVKQLGEMKRDKGGIWANASTGEKVMMGISLFLGGLFGGKEQLDKAINKRIDTDLAQQKFDYERGLDMLKGKQNAFGMAMDRYRDADTADAMVRVAAIDSMLQKLGEKQAEGRGVEAANRGEELRAKLLADRERTIAEGLRFLQASRVEPRYAMSIRGQQLPGTLSQSDAQKYAVEHGVKPAEKTDEILTKGGVDLAQKRMEIAAKREERTDEGAKDIAHEVTKAGIPRLRALAENAMAALHKSPGGKAEAMARYVGGKTVFGDALPNAVLSENANAREQAYQAFANLNMHDLSGGAISSQEEARLKRQLGDASDPVARERALQSVLASLDEAEKAIKGGASPAAQEKYDRQRDVAKSSRPSVPSGAKKGW